MVDPTSELMLEFALWRRGASALRGCPVLGRGSPSEMVHVGLVRRVVRPKETEEQRWSRRLWRVVEWRAADLGQAWQRVRRAMGWTGRRSICGQRAGRRRRRMFGAWRNFGGKVQRYWQCVRRPWTVCRHVSIDGALGLRRHTSRRCRDWPRCGERPWFHGIGREYWVVQKASN